MSITSRSLCAIALAGFTAVIGMVYTASAQETLTEPINHWYQALGTNDAEMLDSNLAGNAEIELRDLEITLTKEEFIDSLDQWAELNGEAELFTCQIDIDGSQIVVEVCYRFSPNEVLNRESVTVVNGLISRSVQEQIGDACTGF